MTSGEMRRVLDLGHLIGALEAAHRESRPEIADGLIGPREGRYLIRSALNRNGPFGSKLISIFPGNPDRHGLPSVQALLVLFDGTNGRPRAVLEATELTWWKTAADSGLGSRLLARPDSSTLVVAGAGGLAPWLIRGHLAAQPSLSRVRIWNRTPGRAQDLAAELREEDIPAESVTDLEAAVRGADVVCTATMAAKPFLKGEWLRPGTHVDLVGSFSPDTREADADVLTAGPLFVDNRHTALQVGEIMQPVKEGAIAVGDIRGDLYELVGGRCEPRTSPGQITVFKNAGGAHLDLIVGAALLSLIEGNA
ncbi:MAG: ornithine cyclodeaminase family protein [Hyphomicrobiales bacterium]